MEEKKNDADLSERLNAIEDDSTVREGGLSGLITWLIEKSKEYSIFIRILFYFGVIILAALNAVYWSIKIVFISSWNLAKAAWKSVQEERKRRKYRASKILLACVQPFAWVVGLVAPLIVIVVLLTTVLIIGDRALYMNMDQDPWVIAKVAEFDKKGSVNLTERERVAAIVHATWLQLEKELNGKGGWMSNDVGPLGLFDNPQHREKGVRLTTRTLVEAESNLFTRISGGNAKQDSYMYGSYAEANLSFGDKVWGQYFVYSSESNYAEGIALLKKYEAKLLAGEGNPNATTDDLKQFFEIVITKILDKAHDPVRDRGYEVPFNEVDDEIYEAAGYVAPLYNVLPVVFAAYRHEIDKNTSKQIDASISLMREISRANPGIVTAFGGWSNLGDHRSKMARYLDQLKDMLDSIQKALKT